MTTTVDLLDALRAHLAAFEVPALCSVSLITSTSEPRVSAQLASYHPPQIAADLLAWADTLTTVTLTVWRVPDGQWVHLCVSGELSNGLTAEVYRSMPFTGEGIGADLAPRSRTTVPLPALRVLATPEQVTL